MKTQLIGVWVSLTVHAIVACFLYNISQGFSPGTRTLVLDLSLKAAGPTGKAGPRKEGAHPHHEFSTPGEPNGEAGVIPSLPGENTPKSAGAAAPPISPEPRPSQPGEPQPVKHDSAPEPRLLEQEKPEPVHQSPPLAPELPEPEKQKPLREAKDLADPPEQTASTTRESQKMAAPSEPVSAKTSDDEEDAPLAWHRSQGDPHAGPETYTENILPETMAGQVSSGGGGFSGGAGETYAQNTAIKGEDSYLSAHFGFIRRRLRQSLCYPNIARQSGWSGKILIAFTIHTDGLVDQIEIKKSCGIPLLDQSALATVRNACPFPKPPMTVRIIIPILYQLN